MLVPYPLSASFSSDCVCEYSFFLNVRSVARCRHISIFLLRDPFTREFADSTVEPNVVVRPTTATFSFYANFVNTLFSRLSYFASMPFYRPVSDAGRADEPNEIFLAKGDN